MINRTDEEIDVKVRQIWDFGEHDGPKIEITRSENHIDLEISQMYNSPGLSFPRINALAEFFDTLNVETESEFDHGGCDTCDYGSSYGFILRISPGDPYKKIE